VTVPTQVRVSGVSNVTANEQDVLVYRSDVPRSTTRTAVIYCHSGGANALEAFRPVPDSSYFKILRMVAAAGLPIMSHDLGGPWNWGNPTSSTRINSVHSYMQTKLGVRSDRLLLLGASMGAMCAINHAHNNSGLVKAVAGVFPAIDQEDPAIAFAVNDMNAAYGDQATRQGLASTRNPYTYRASYTVPTHLLYSTNDAVTVPGKVTAFASANTATTAVAMAAAGGHFDGVVSDSEAQAVVNFLLTRA